MKIKTILPVTALMLLTGALLLFAGCEKEKEIHVLNISFLNSTNKYNLCKMQKQNKKTYFKQNKHYLNDCI